MRLFGAVAALACTWLLAVTPLAAQEDALIAVGDAAPAVVIPDLAGGSFDLADVLGKRPLLVEFWATWCTSCEAMLPRLRQAHEEYGIHLVDAPKPGSYDAVVLAVAHHQFVDAPQNRPETFAREGGVVFDVKGRLVPGERVFQL